MKSIILEELENKPASLELLDCDILFIKEINNAFYYFDSVETNLLEIPNIRYIIVEDIKLFEYIRDNFEEAYDVKIEEAYIGGSGDYYNPSGKDPNKKLLRFFRIRDRKMYTIVKNFEKYYYIPDEKGSFLTIDNRKVSKCFDYSEKFREENIDHYEIDINIMTRYALDQAKRKRIKTGKKYRICNFDIETNASVDCVNTPEAIISIAANDSFTGETKYWDIRYLDIIKEREMLEDFFRYVSKFDIIAAFNGNKFDIPYLVNRAKKVHANICLLTGIAGCEPSSNHREKDAAFPWWNFIPGINIVDLMGLAEKSIGYLDVKLPDKKLDTLGKYILGEQKIETDTPAILFKNKEFEKLKEYNIQDVNISVKLDKKLGLIEVLLATIELVPGLNIDAAVWNSKIIDFYLLSTFDVVMPSVDRERIVDIKGAIVTNTVPGIHDNVAVMDVAGMYPSGIRTFNISPDTKDPDGDIKLGQYTFNSKKPGILVHFVDKFTKLRAHYKKLLKENENSPDYKTMQLKEFTIKKILASTYGVFGFVGFRHFDNDIANAITFFGREFLTYMNKTAEDSGYTVISADTDGNCIKHNEDKPDFDKLAKDINDGIPNWIRQYTSNEEVIKNHKLLVEYETLFSRVIFTTAKKKYMGLVSMMKGKNLKELKFYGKGNELMRKDTPAGIKEELRKIIMAVLTNPDKSNNLQIIKDKVIEIRKSLPNWTKDDLIIYKEINRNFEEYKVMPLHVRAALASNKYLGTNFSRQNYKGGYVFIKSRLHPEVDAFFMNESTNLTDDFQIDYDKYFEKFIDKKVDLIFGPTIHDEVFRKNKLLSDFW